MVKEDMNERAPSPQTVRERVRRSVATGALSLSILPLLSGHDVQAEQLIPLSVLESGTSVSDYLALQTLYQYQQPEDGDAAPVFDMLPPEHSEALKRGIKESIVQLAIRIGDVDQIWAVKNIEHDDPLTGTHIMPYDDGSFTTLDINASEQPGRIAIGFGAGAIKPEQRVYTDDYMVRLALIHEAIHGLNDEWWIALYKNFPVDEELAAKITKVRERCGPINTGLRDAVALSQSVNFSSFNEPPYETCSPTVPLPEWLELGENAFRCVDESHMLKDSRNAEHNSAVGHPYDNATELASSATTVLFLDPGYMKHCFEEMGDAGLQLKQYVRAVLDISFYHRPELEQILRHNTLTAQTIDYLFTF